MTAAATTSVSARPQASSLATMLDGSPFVAYSYAYPHKTAYRPFETPIPLRDLWKIERRDSLFLYLHVPFCEYRCGFCNLFTQSNPTAGLPTLYLKTLRSEAAQVRDALGEASFARLAIGGGTPTFLDCGELEDLFSICVNVLGAHPRRIPVSVEASPATVDREKLQLLREFGTDRLSIGVQTFDDAESGQLGRPQRRAESERALAAIRDVGFPTLNIDLIYGGESQTIESWLRSLRSALSYRPEELYLYPLYVRSLTGLGKRRRDWVDFRLNAYREARQLLLSEGYSQVSFRMFRATHAPHCDGPVYCCQEDGMVGLGCGARSYATDVHYSSEYAVGQKGVRSILAAYVNRSAESFDLAHYGIRLPSDDRRRRYAIMSVLQSAGLSRADFAHRFGGDVFEFLPQLAELEPIGLAEVKPETIRLTAAGMERSDMIGPWLYSERVRRLMESYECR